MPTSLIAPIVGSVASAGVSAGLKGLFGGGGSDDSALSRFTPSGISSGGLNTTFSGSNIGVSPTGDRSSLVGNIAATFPEQANIIGGLRSQVAPGYNAFLRARLDELNANKASAIGNLRENLARRRVLGSSFGNDAISRANSEFAKAADAITADSFLKSLEMTTQLTQQEFAARRGEFQTGLDELNLEANTALALAGKATDALAKNAQVQALLDAQSQQGAGKFFGQLAQPVGTAIGNSAGKFFSGFNFGGGGGPDFSFA